MIAWYEAKKLIAQATGVSMDALHVAAGVLLLLVLAAILRRSIADYRPWAAVLALTLLNEASDFWTELWPDTGMQIREGVKDILSTMLLPSLLLLTARCFPRLYGRDPVARGEPERVEPADSDQAAGGVSPTA